MRGVLLKRVPSAPFVGVDTVGPVDVWVGGGEVAGGERIFVVGADDDNFFDAIITSEIECGLGFFGGEELAVVEVAVRVN